MIKEIKKMRLRTFFFLMFQTIAIILISLFYIFNWFETRDYITIDIIFAIAVGLIILNILFVWIQVSRINRVRTQNDLASLEIIGSDVKEAYNFGMIGLIVVDKNLNIIWNSDLFRERKIFILDQNILTWQPALKRLVEVSEALDENLEDTVKLEIDSRNYEVKYLNDANLFIFKDITDFEFIYDQNVRQAPVVGIIMIDNFTDAVATREISNPMTAIITSQVFDYCQKYKVLVRQYRDDAFILVTNYESFEKLRADNFSILRSIREHEENKEMKLTLSMAFAYNFPDVMRLSDMAVQAIDTAIARGGDQVVISKYGEENEYFGGASIGAERRNRTSIRLKTDTLFSHVREASNVIIMGHTQMDLDALGGCLGLKALADYVIDRAVNRKSKQKARIVYSPNLTEQKTKAAINLMFTKDEIEEIFISPQELANEKGENSLINSKTLLILADVSRPSMLMDPKLIERIDRIIIIDHHRRTDEFVDNRLFDYIETTASSTSEMVAEMIYYGNTPEFTLSNRIATLMLTGIYLDTNHFRSNTTGSRTFLGAMVLEDFGADATVADELLKDEYEEYTLITKIMASLETISYGVVLAKADDADIITPATLAKVANQCMQVKGVNAAFVIGYSKAKEAKISARSDGTINVQLILEKLGGGGHQASAGASFKGKTLTEVETELKEVLDLYLPQARVH
ncbi:MAG: DHH family phosphoesterase [Bacilli bacterium]|jgi:c-di-AMP phosphodiesterase-like protein